MDDVVASDVPPRLHELETEVMTELWQLGEAPVRTVLGRLNARDKERKYTTIMTVMTRLHGKGLLVRRREGRTDHYAPAMSQAQYEQARARVEVGALVEEFGDLALAQFAARMDGLDPERRDQLRRLAGQ